MYAKTSSQLLTIGVLVWIISVQNFAIVVNGDRALREKLCKSTEDYESCVRCENADPTSSSASDTGLVQIAITCAVRSMNTLRVDTTYCQTNTSDPKMFQAFDFCFKVFLQATEIIQSVRNKVNGRDFGGAKGDITGYVLVKINSCYQFLQNVGAQMPQIMSTDLDIVNRDWGKIVVKMLEGLL